MGIFPFYRFQYFHNIDNHWKWMYNCNVYKPQRLQIILKWIVVLFLMSLVNIDYLWLPGSRLDIKQWFVFGKGGFLLFRALVYQATWICDVSILYGYFVRVFSWMVDWGCKLWRGTFGLLPIWDPWSCSDYICLIYSCSIFSSFSSFMKPHSCCWNLKNKIKIKILT